MDIHTHTFNARFLPIQNIALGKRDMHPFFSLAADPVVIAITELITRATDEDIDPPGMAAELRLMEDVASKANLLSAALEGGMGPAKQVSARELQKDPRVTGLQKIAVQAVRRLSKCLLRIWHPRSHRRPGPAGEIFRQARAD